MRQRDKVDHSLLWGPTCRGHGLGARIEIQSATVHAEAEVQVDSLYGWLSYSTCPARRKATQTRAGATGGI